MMSNNNSYLEKDDYKKESIIKSMTSILIDSGIKVLSRADLSSVISKRGDLKSSEKGIPRAILLGSKVEKESNRN